jgi:hypothetical protein
MPNPKYKPTYQTVEKIGYEDGVYYTMEVYYDPNQTLPYYSYGYAMASGVKLTDWGYSALDQEEAYSQETKDYLIRELKPSVKTQLQHLTRIGANYNG